MTERVLVGYDECRCILTQYCDGKCRPVFAHQALKNTTRVKPYAYVYEWDYSPGVVHRSLSQAPYNGRGPDRTIQVFEFDRGSL